jgi:hypothetical protein
MVFAVDVHSCTCNYESLEAAKMSFTSGEWINKLLYIEIIEYSLVNNEILNHESHRGANSKCCKVEEADQRL